MLLQQIKKLNNDIINNIHPIDISFNNRDVGDVE